MYRKSRAVALFLLSLLTVGSLTFGQAFAAGEDSRFDALKRFSQVLDIVERYYVKETPRPDLVNGALKGMLESLDPHSTMLSKEEFKDMQESTSGEFFGIGIEITMENNQLTVVTPIEDTPADKGGMKSGDIILAVGGKPTLEMTLQEAVSHIRGPKGSEVVLTILHRDSKEPVDLRIKRDAIPLISVKSRELEPGYYWVRLTRFSERTTQELLDALSDAKRKGPIKGIILDLRNNPGGLLDQAVSVSDAFLNKGVIVSMRGRQEETAREFVAKPQDTDIIDTPLVVLVNGGSASASEIVAGALGDQKRALLVGERTFGKGSVQNIIPLSDGSGLKLTVALYYTPSGRSIQAEGIMPDLEVPFEAPKEKPAPLSSLRMIREKDLNKHLEKTDGDKGKASSRSYGGFNLFRSLEQLSGLLESYGGHELAAGFTIRRACIEPFREKMLQLCSSFRQSDACSTALAIDCEIPPELLTIENIQALDELEPCGAGCPRPILCMRGLQVTELTEVGGGKHLRLRLSKGPFTWGAIFFSTNAQRAAVAQGDVVDIAFTPQINEYRSMRSVQLNLVDIRPDKAFREAQGHDRAVYRKHLSGGELSCDEADSLLPARQDFVAVWRYLAAFSQDGTLCEELGCLSRKISRCAKLPLSAGKTRICLDVLAEQGLVQLEQRPKTLLIRLCADGRKVDLEKSPILIHLKKQKAGT